MRVLVLDTYYPDFLAQHYAEHPGLVDEPYESQHASLIERSFGTTDAYSHHLHELGHEAAEVIANCDPQQRRWAAEHGMAGRRLFGLDPTAPGLRGRLGRWARLRTLQQQIDDFRPDVVYAQDPGSLTEPVRDAARDAGAVLAAQVGSGPPDDEVLAGFDVLFTPVPSWLERFRASGMRAELLMLGFYAVVNDRLRAAGVDPDAGSQRSIDVSTIAGFSPGVHTRRLELIDRAASSIPIDVWGYGRLELPPSSAVRRRHHGEAWGLDMYSVLARSKIVVNVHGEAAEGYAANMRLFEATGSGALLLTDGGSNLAELFEPGREVVTFDDADDLVAKARHYLEHDDERRAIAAAGQARTLREHTYSARIAELATALEAELARR